MGIFPILIANCFVKNNKQSIKLNYFIIYSMKKLKCFEFLPIFIIVVNKYNHTLIENKRVVVYFCIAIILVKLRSEWTQVEWVVVKVINFVCRRIKLMVNSNICE